MPSHVPFLSPFRCESRLHGIDMQRQRRVRILSMRYASDYSIWGLVVLLIPRDIAAADSEVVRNEPKTVIGEVRGPRDDISATESKGVTGSIKRVSQINTERHNEQKHAFVVVAVDHGDKHQLIIDQRVTTERNFNFTGS